MSIRLQLGFEGNYTDQSGNGWVPTQTGVNNSFASGGPSGQFLQNSNPASTLGYGVRYDNSQNIINFDVSAGFTFTGYFKISAAQRAGGAVAMRLIEAAVVGPNFPGFVLYMLNTGSGNDIVARITDNGGTDWAATASVASTYADDMWHNFTWTADGSLNRLYLDGTLVASAAIGGSTGNPGGYSFSVGAASNALADVWPGSLDAIVISDEPLPPFYDKAKYLRR